jgi:hypothetical protein
MKKAGRPAKLHHEFEARNIVARNLAGRFFLRFHASLILLWTFGVGLLATRLLSLLHVDSMPWRYCLSVWIAYLGFLLAIRVWLWYAGYSRHLRGRVDFDVPMPSGSSQVESANVLQGQGGDSIGAGASHDFGVADLGGGHDSGMIEAAGHIAQGAGEGLVGAAGEGCLPVIIVGLAIAAVLGLVFSAAWMIGAVPEVLVDVAFDAVLTAGLIRITNNMRETDWTASVFRRTWIPVAIVLIVLMIFGAWAQHRYPEIRNLAGFIRVLRHG